MAKAFHQGCAGFSGNIRITGTKLASNRVPPALMAQAHESIACWLQPAAFGLVYSSPLPNKGVCHGNNESPYQ
jgi:hypothetical protein